MIQYANVYYSAADSNLKEIIYAKETVFYQM